MKLPSLAPVLVVGVLAGLVGGAPAPKPRQTEPDEKTVEAYKKLGATCFKTKAGRCGKRLPGFRFKQCDDTKLMLLPPVDVPFALHLDNTEVTDDQG